MSKNAFRRVRTRRADPLRFFSKNAPALVLPRKTRPDPRGGPVTFFLQKRVRTVLTSKSASGPVPSLPRKARPVASGTEGRTRYVFPRKTRPDRPHLEKRARTRGADPLRFSRKTHRTVPTSKNASGPRKARPDPLCYFFSKNARIKNRKNNFAQFKEGRNENPHPKLGETQNRTVGTKPPYRKIDRLTLKLTFARAVSRYFELKNEFCFKRFRAIENSDFSKIGGNSKLKSVKRVSGKIGTRKPPLGSLVA